MDEAKHLARIKNSADDLSATLQTPSNVPLADYLDLTSLRALAEALSLEPSEVESKDLEVLHIIRDGLYEMAEKASEVDEESEHSIHQVQNAINKLYVDLERLLRLNSDRISETKSKVLELENSNSRLASDVPLATVEVTKQAQEVITNVQETSRTINVSLVHIDSVNLTLVKDLNLNIKRLSASVFAISMKFNQGIIYEGTIKFLNENVDNIISSLRQLANTFRKSYSSAQELLDNLNPLIEKSTRFVKLVATIISGLFGDQDGSEGQFEVKFGIIGAAKSGALTTGCITDSGRAFLGGRKGLLVLSNPKTGQVNQVQTRLNSDITKAADLGNDQIAVGTQDGLVVVALFTSDRPVEASYSEHISGLVVMPWGGRKATIVTGSRDGALRRWSLAGGLTQQRGDFVPRDIQNKVGRSIQGMCQWQSNLVVATGDRLFVLDEDFEIVTQVVVGEKIKAVCALDDDSVMVAGDGFLGQVNLTKGGYARIMTASPKLDYVGIARLETGLIVAAASSGKVSAIEVSSGTEIGVCETQMEVRGLMVSGTRILVHGGSWQSVGQSLISMVWSKEQLKSS